MAGPSSQTLRNWWAPACRPPYVTVTLHGGGKVSVRPSIVPAVQALDACLRAAGYLTRPRDTGAFNCRRITGGSGYSMHAYGIALDINWQSNAYSSRLRTDMPRAMTNAITAIRTNSGAVVWRWGGNYTGNKDSMHFEIVCTPRDIAAGINAHTVPGGPAKVTRPTAPTLAPPKVPVNGVHSTPSDKARNGPIHWLQDMLNMVRAKQHKPMIPADGKYGPSTVAAVKDFQSFVNAMADLAHSKAARWTVSGSAGPRTVGGLCWWVNTYYHST